MAIFKIKVKYISFPILQYIFYNKTTGKEMIKNKMRWRKELLDIEKNQTKDFDILNLQDAHETGIALVELCGPLGSPYEGYTFRLSYNGRNIPFEPPIIQFLQIPWNPFVCYKTGNICCDILTLQEKNSCQGWSPALTLQSVILSIISLLGEKELPENEPGLNIEAAAKMRLKYSNFFIHARQLSQSKCFKKQNNCKDQDKSKQKNPEDIEKSDIEFMQGKDKFMNDPLIKQKYTQKLSKISTKKQQ